MSLIDLTPEQKSRVQMAQIIRRAMDADWRYYIDIWRDCFDHSIIYGRWNGSATYGGIQTASSVDELLNTLAGPYEGESAEEFFERFRNNHPVLVQLREFCETNIAGFKVDLEKLYSGLHISGEYTTISGKMMSQIAVQIQMAGEIGIDDSPLAVKITAQMPHNTRSDCTTVAHFRDMQEIIDVVMILVVQSKAMGLEVIEGE